MSEEGKFIITPREIIEDSRLTLRHIKVLLALYSFRNKNTDLVYPSREAVTKRCGIRPNSISTTTSELVKLGWLEKTGMEGRKAYRVTVPNLSTLQESCTLQESSTSKLQESCSHKNTIEENPTKNPPTPQLPEWLDLETWDEFKKHRKKIKKPMTEFAEKKMLIKLGKLKDQGHDPTKLLEEVIINGWQGIVVPETKQTQTKYLSADERARENTSWLDEEILRRRQDGEEDRGHNTGGIKVIQ